MATKFSISSDSESDPSEEVDERESSNSLTEQAQHQVSQHHTLTLPELRLTGTVLAATGLFMSVYRIKLAYDLRRNPRTNHSHF